MSEVNGGKPKLKHEGYLYCLLREKDGLKTWRCDKRQCKAIATTFEDNVFTTREHLHEPDMKHSEQLKVLEKMKEKAANSNEQPRKIVQDTTATILSWSSWKRSKPLFSITLWNQFENARNGNQKTNNNVEGWHRACQLGMGFAQPTIDKILQYLRNEQSFTENRIARIRAGEILPANAKVERHRQRLQQLLNHYQNNLSVLEGLSFNIVF